MQKILSSPLLALALLVASHTPASAVTVALDPGASWQGFMNVFNLPSAGGAFQFGAQWGVADLNSSWSVTTLTLSPNTIGDPNPYWYNPSGGPGSTGNKIMEANMYVEPAGSLPGQTVTFNFTVSTNTLTGAHTAFAFIKDFAPDFSSAVSTVIPLTPGAKSLSLATINDPARHVQYGFQMVGPDVWFTDVAPFGSVVLVPTAVPEPATFALLGTVAAGLLTARRRRKLA